MTAVMIHPAISVAQCVGVLGIDEARMFAVLANQLVDGDLTMHIEGDGTIRVLRPEAS